MFSSISIMAKLQYHFEVEPSNMDLLQAHPTEGCSVMALTYNRRLGYRELILANSKSNFS